MKFALKLKEIKETIDKDGKYGVIGSERMIFKELQDEDLIKRLASEDGIKKDGISYYIKITPKGEGYIRSYDNEMKGLDLNEKAMKLAEIANELSEKANALSEKSNVKADKSNVLSKRALIWSIVAVAVSLLIAAVTIYMQTLQQPNK
jgi:DNA-binding MarR family transcriptional regulator